jgi:hypothetical protein
MGRTPDRKEVVGLGELEVFHPACRTRILITDLFRGQETLTFEGICATCDTYVRLELTMVHAQREIRGERAS